MITDLITPEVTAAVIAGVISVIGWYVNHRSNKTLAQHDQLHDAALKRIEREHQVQFDELTQKLNANLRHATYVSGKQYDTEHEAYRTIWNALVELKQAAAHMEAPHHEQPGPHIADALRQQFRDFAARYQQAILLLEKQKPFVHSTVYESLGHLITKTFTQAAVSAIPPHPHSRRDAVDWQQSLEHVAEVQALIEKCSKAIHDRLNTIQVVETGPSS